MTNAEEVLAMVRELLENEDFVDAVLSLRDKLRKKKRKKQ